MPDPHIARPPVPQIYVADRCAIGEDAIIVTEIKVRHGFRGGDRSMMRIVEQKTIVTVVSAMPADARY
jgi:hypothetical protein